VTTADPDHLARDAYEAYRAAHPTPFAAEGRSQWAGTGGLEGDGVRHRWV